MICSNCSKKITNNCKFCIQCGEEIVIDVRSNDVAYIAQSKPKN